MNTASASASGIVAERRFVCASTEETSTSKHGNSNKFWTAVLYSDDSVLVTWGRVGTAGQTKKYPGVGRRFFDTKCGEKLKNAYTEIDVIDSAGANVAVNAVAKGDLKSTVEDQIAKGDPAVSKLVHYLAERNVHNIANSTTLTYDKSTGLFSTPLGIVTQPSVDKARVLLATAQAQIVNTTMKATDERTLNRVATDFLMLVPQDIGRDRPTFERIFPSIDAIQKFSDILDALEGSLAMVAKGGATVVKKEAKKVFEVTMRQILDTAEIERIRTKFRATANSQHESRHLDVEEVYELNIAQMRTAFEADGRKLTNIQELWHGTSVGNVLSIMSKGLIIPTSASNGRMFGNGVYFSDQSTKALNYAYGYWGGGARDNNCFMFLAEVAMGRSFTPKTGWGQRFPEPGFDSTFAKAGESSVYNNEMIVYRLGQCCITRLIKFAPRK